MEQTHYDHLTNEVPTEKTIKCWGQAETSLLIKLYRAHEPHTASKKQLWTKLSELLAKHNYYFSPLQVQNKWKSLGRVKNRRPSFTEIMVQQTAGKTSSAKSIKLELCEKEEPNVPSHTNTNIIHDVIATELFLSEENQMERVNDDIDGNCMLSDDDDDLSSGSSARDYDCKKAPVNGNSTKNGTLSELKEIINKFIDYYDERERATTKYELRKIRLMEEKNRILSERNRLIKERNDILKSCIKNKEYKK